MVKDIYDFISGVPIYYHVLFILVVYILVRLFRQTRTKGVIHKGYYHIDDKSESLYLFCEYSRFESTRSGAFTITRFTLKKFDLINLEFCYERKIAAFASSAFEGSSINCSGLDDKYYYRILDGKKLLIIDLKTGKKIATKKTILQHNHNIKNISLMDAFYSQKYRALVFADNQGARMILNVESFKLTHFPEEPEKTNNVSMLNSINPSSGTKLNTSKLHNSESNPVYLINPKKKDKKSNNDNLVIKLLSLGIYSDAGKLIVSACNNDKNEIWRHNLDSLFIKPRFGGRNRIKCIETGDDIIFMLLAGKPHLISMSRVNKKTGEILKGPIRSINRKLSL